MARTSPDDDAPEQLGDRYRAEEPKRASPVLITNKRSAAGLLSSRARTAHILPFGGQAGALRVWDGESPSRARRPLLFRARKRLEGEGERQQTNHTRFVHPMPAATSVFGRFGG